MGTELSHGYDQAIRLGEEVLEFANQEVDDKIEQALLAGSPTIALDFGYSLIQTGQMKGVQLARLFYQLNQVWKTFDTDDEIEDAVFKSMGVSGQKFRDYKDVYKYILKDHPEMVGKPWGGLMAILPAARDGAFEADDWERLALAHDRKAMTAIRRDAWGLKTKGHAMVTIRWDRDGFITAYKGGEEPEVLGSLKRTADTEHGQIALDRLMPEGKVMYD